MVDIYFRMDEDSIPQMLGGFENEKEAILYLLREFYPDYDWFEGAEIRPLYYDGFRLRAEEHQRVTVR